MTVIPFKRKRALSAPAALKYLRDIGKDGLCEAESYTAIASLLGWDRAKTWKAVDRWKKAGKVIIESGPESGKLVLRILPTRRALERGKGTGVTAPKKGTGKRKKGSQNAAVGITADAPQIAPESVPAEASKFVPESVPTLTQNAVPSVGVESAELVARRHEKSKTYVNQISADATPVIPPFFAPERAGNTSGNGPVSTPKDTPEIPPSAVPESAPESAPEHVDENWSRQSPEGTKQEHPNMSITAELTSAEAPAEARSQPPSQISQATPTANLPADGRILARAKGGGRGGALSSTFAARATSPLAVLISLALAAVAAYFSIAGLVVVYPWEFWPIVIAGVVFELGKFVGVSFLGAHWRQISILMRAVLIVLLTVVEGINATGVYSRLIEDHVGPAGARASSYQQADAGEGAKVEVAQSRVSDLDRQIAQIDDAIAAATKRGRTNGAMQLAERERKHRAQLSTERDKAQQELSGLRAGRTGLAAKHQEAEAATLPVKYAADLLEEMGALKPGTDPEKIVRWLSLAFLLALDPLALALTFAVSSRRAA